MYIHIYIHIYTYINIYIYINTYRSGRSKTELLSSLNPKRWARSDNWEDSFAKRHGPLEEEVTNCSNPTPENYERCVAVCYSKTMYIIKCQILFCFFHHVCGPTESPFLVWKRALYCSQRAQYFRRGARYLRKITRQFRKKSPETYEARTWRWAACRKISKISFMVNLRRKFRGELTFENFFLRPRRCVLH